MSSRLVVGLAVLTLVCLAAPVAEAKPHVSFKVPRAPAAGKAIRFVYATSGLRRGQRVVVQRRRGTARAWRTAVKLPRKRSAPARFPGLAVDKYRLRIAALGHDGIVLAQQNHSLKVVPFSPRAASAQDQQFNALEQQRYATETVNLSYTQFVARQSDFRAHGCTHRWPEAPGDPPTSDNCHKPPPYNSFDWTDDGCSGRSFPVLGPPVSNIYRDLFNEPCRLHDFGYHNFGKGLTLKRDEDTRKWIDHRFLEEMVSLCYSKFDRWWQTANKVYCLSEAGYMWTFVHTFNHEWSSPGAQTAPTPTTPPTTTPPAITLPTSPRPPTPPVTSGSTPTFTVMNTSETPPDGVWFRNSAHTGDTDRVTGHGVYAGERVQLLCYGWGDAVGAYSNRLWYDVTNLTRPTNAGRSNDGWLNAHYINDGVAANQIDAGVRPC